MSELELAMQRPDGMMLLPADTFYLGVQFEKRYPADAAPAGASGQQLADSCPAPSYWRRSIRSGCRATSGFRIPRWRRTTRASC